MRRGGNQTDVAVLLVQALVILADGHEAGVLALRAGVGLQRDRVEAGRSAKHALQLVEELAVALHLVERREGMDRSEEHTSELQSLMRISYAVFCLKKKKKVTLTLHTTSSQRMPSESVRQHG